LLNALFEIRYPLERCVPPSFELARDETLLRIDGLVASRS
jgi:hypothetical protein